MAGCSCGSSTPWTPSPSTTRSGRGRSGPRATWRTSGTSSTSSSTRWRSPPGGQASSARPSACRARTTARAGSTARARRRLLRLALLERDGGRVPVNVVGILVGRENTFPSAFIETVDRKGASRGVRAEMASLGGAREIETPRYAVIVDRISHEVPYFRAHLKSAALQGTIVVNDPFWCEADEKFFQCTLARKLGVAVPKTVVLPNKSYISDVNEGSLRNLVYPLDWDGLIAYVGLPAILKPNTGGG